jgi:hypothetical protein
MTDIVKQSIAELQGLVRCRCHPAYKDRKLQDPECECDSQDAMKIVSDHIDELELEVKNLRKALQIYERERIRFKHAKPEMSGEFFIAGYHGPKDDNVMPQFIEVCPAYGAGWVMIYEDTGRKISYEGS